MSEEKGNKNSHFQGHEVKERATASNAIDIPSISLPKGGGAIQGIGEKFATNPVTGTGSMTVPITTSPGRSGFSPQLSLSYDSGSGNSHFGFGWTLALPQIVRKTAKGLPEYIDTEESDVFLISGAEDLVPVLENDISDNEYIIHSYRPRIEGLFARIERWTSKLNGEVHWRSITKDNVLSIYGKNEASRIVSPDNNRHVFSWLICESRDDKGNAIIYDYKQDDGVGVDFAQPCEANRGGINDQRRTTNRYIKRIRYGNEITLLENGKRPRFVSQETIDETHWMFEVVFDYGEHDTVTATPDDSNDWIFRADPFSSYRSGFEIRTTRLCQRVLMFHHFPGESGVGNNCLVSSTDFTYSHQQEPEYASNPIYTFLKKVAHSGYKLNADDRYVKRSIPPLEFKYSEPAVQETVEKIDSQSLENLPIGVDGTAYQWVDLHGEGTPGILTEQAGSWFYKRNVSPMHTNQVSFSPIQAVITKPNMSFASGAQMMDLAGDGMPDVVTIDGPSPGFYEHDHQEGWNNFQAFRSRPTYPVQDPNVRFLDLDGDGNADIFITEDDAFVWHASMAEAGFAPAQRVAKALDEETGPRIVFADGTQSIYLADFSGDGLTDLVRIRNNEVCYWPNLGYGHFGAKVNMNNAPHFDQPDQFAQSRIRLADIDGSGTIDIIYLHRDGVRLYFNQSGNGLSDAKELRVFPQVNDLVSIKVADLLGNGTACLVWSSSLPDDAQQAMRYVNLMGGEKPHLLIKSTNNFGAETEIHYVPSTKFYLQDKENKKPWITRLPFPVHVVEKITLRDKWRKTSFSSTYSYHHGYFDGVEREFRGFGRVEQLDMENYGKFQQGNISSPYITEDKTLYQPPIKTITWFHTGAYLQRDKIFNQFEHEYFPNNLSKDARSVLGGFKEKQIDQPDFNDADLSNQELREAFRACKGMMLRQEVYELDVDALENRQHQYNKLFSTVYQGCNINMLQPCADNRHAVFLVTESEVISYSYELDLQTEDILVDPRISHVLNLKTDQYGNVLQSVTAVYPRRHSYQDASLPEGADRLITRVQQETHLAYTENRLTKTIPAEIDNYRLPLPCEALSYELTGIIPAASNDYFELEQMRQYRLSNAHQTQGDDVVNTPYHETANVNVPQKRLLEQTQVLYFSDDLQTPLSLGEFNSLALPYESYTLAMTDDLLAAILSEKYNDSVKADLATSTLSGYQYLPDEGQYWIRSGIAGFAADAAEHFFLPEQYTDPFGNTTTLEYDRRDLYIARSTDPAANQVQIKAFDYRFLQPSEMEDINGNLSEVVFDALGLPTAVALKGKGDEGDSLESFSDELINPEIVPRIQFFTGQYLDDNARNLLGTATARHIYDFGEQLDENGNISSYGHRPASAATIAREQHISSSTSGNVSTVHDQISPLQVGFEYSDGGGNVLVTKVQAEPETEGGPLRWIANGKIILNNKGKPVKQYEPYFSESGHHFEEPQEKGVTPVLYYDSAGRVTRTELPDGTFSKVEFTSWDMRSYDANDTVLESQWYQENDRAYHDPSTPLPKDPVGNVTLTPDQLAGWRAAQHASTPATVFLDSLGREVISVEWNKFRDSDDILHEEKYLTFSKLDAEGKPLWIRDARGNLVMQYITPVKPTRAADEINPSNPEDVPAETVPCYDIAGNLLFQHSMDAGERWIINDATGQPFYAWDKNDRITASGEATLEFRIMHTSYDVLRRPLKQALGIHSQNITDTNENWSIANLQTIDRFVFGDNDSALTDAKSRNLRGQLYQHYDASGRTINERFDFKGNPLKVSRQLSSKYDNAVIHWSTDSPETGLEQERFVQNTQYDALNRMVRMENWHRENNNNAPPPAIYTPVYNERAILVSETLSVQGRTQKAIKHISYDAKGQRERIEYGNNTVTRYEYDKKTFRLKQLRTTKNGFDPDMPGFHSAGQNNNVLQQLNYTYDPVGNITEIDDEAIEPVFFKNQEVRGRSLYQYDSLYRLIKAQGREDYNATVPSQISSKTTGYTFPVHNSSGSKALRNYTQQYHYDAVGNIMRMRHVVADQSRWTRHYSYADESNRLLRTWQGNDEANSTAYRYDTHGSMLNLNCTPDEFNLRWDYRDMIHHVNLGGGGQAWYNYDSSKQRTRKRIVRAGGNEIEERLYLDGMEVYRHWLNDALLEEIETHHMFADDQRVLIVEDVIKTSSDLGVNTFHKYQYRNHLGSVGMELNADASIISYEEYHPFGTTAFSASNKEVKSVKKRYRYTGMERDEETGLSYHTARYYLPWLGRWGSADPIGVKGGINLYGYVRCNPIRFYDTSGHADPDYSGETTLSKMRRWFGTAGKAIELIGEVVLGSVEHENPGGAPEEEPEDGKETKSKKKKNAGPLPKKDSKNVYATVDKALPANDLTEAQAKFIKKVEKLEKSLEMKVSFEKLKKVIRARRSKRLKIPPNIKPKSGSNLFSIGLNVVGGVVVEGVKDDMKAHDKTAKAIMKRVISEDRSPSNEEYESIRLGGMEFKGIDESGETNFESNNPLKGVRDLFLYYDDFIEVMIEISERESAPVLIN